MYSVNDAFPFHCCQLSYRAPYFTMSPEKRMKSSEPAALFALAMIVFTEFVFAESLGCEWTSLIHRKL